MSGGARGVIEATSVEVAEEAGSPTSPLPIAATVTAEPLAIQTVTLSSGLVQVVGEPVTPIAVDHAEGFAWTARRCVDRFDTPGQVIAGIGRPTRRNGISLQWADRISQPSARTAHAMGR